MPKPWFIYSLLGAILIAAMTLFLKYAGNQGLSQQKILFFIFSFGAIFYFGHLFLTGSSFELNWKMIFVLLTAAFFSYLGNLFLLKGVMEAPNPGYSDAVSSLRMVLTTLAAIALFGSELTIMKSFGVGVTILGIILLSF